MLRRALGAALTTALALAAACGAVVTVGALLDGRAFPGELLALFRVQWLLAGAILAAVATVAGRSRIAWTALTLAAVNAAALLPGLAAGRRPDPDRAQLRVLVANTWLANENYDRLFELVRREHPSVIGVTELTRKWDDALTRGLPDYEHRVVRAQPGAYGIGIYSRVPLRDTAIVFPAEGWPAVARATIRVGERDVDLFVVHGPSAIRSGAAERHREFMRGLGAMARAAGDGALLCGDLNAAPWTDGFGELRRRGDLERDDPWRPFEYTWPVWNRLLRIPIDQCLAGDALAVSSRTGPSIGSDHFPLLVEVASVDPPE
jgi:endonuclease/exonuclease/phosphatase (EEP) superfamily protein YafD